jgi:hypothetical protein
MHAHTHTPKQTINKMCLRFCTYWLIELIFFLPLPIFQFSSFKVKDFIFWSGLTLNSYVDLKQIIVEYQNKNSWIDFSLKCFCCLPIGLIIITVLLFLCEQKYKTLTKINVGISSGFKPTSSWVLSSLSQPFYHKFSIYFFINRKPVKFKM